MRYEFPQGNNSWDKDLEEIQKEFGIYIIYKDFEETDLNRSWTGALGEGSTYFGESLNDEQAEFMTKFMKNHIFAYLTPQATRKVLPMYYYMVYSFRSMRLGRILVFMGKISLMAWIIGLFACIPTIRKRVLFTKR